MASSIPLAGLEVAARTLARIALSAALVAGALGCDDGPGASAGDAGDEAPAGEGEGEVGEGEVGEGEGEAGEGGGEAGEGGGEAGEGEGEAEGGAGRRERLEAAQTWMYQISQLDEGDAVAKLAATDYPLLVIEPGHNHRPCTEEFDPAAHGIPAGNADDACANVYDTAAMVAALRAGQPDRLLVAYIDVGQAEWYRDYWAPGWALPTPDQRGNPDFIVSADPDGWEGNYPVAYWHEDWKAIWLGTGAGAGAAGIVRELAELGPGQIGGAVFADRGRVHLEDQPADLVLGFRRGQRRLDLGELGIATR